MSGTDGDMGQAGASVPGTDLALRRPRAFLHFDGMAWPNPDDPLEAEWALRHGTPTRVQQMVAASMMAAYRQLVVDPQRTRNAKVAGIRRTAPGPLPTNAGQPETKTESYSKTETAGADGKGEGTNG